MDKQEELEQSPFKWLFQCIQSQRKWLYANLAGSLCNAILIVSIAYYVNTLLDQALYGGKGSLGETTLLLMLQVLLGAAFMVFRGLTAGKVKTGMMYELRKSLHEKIQSLKVRSLEQTHSGDIISILSNDTSKIENFLSDRLVSLMYYPIALLLIYIDMLIINWKLLLFSTFVIPIVFMISYLVIRSLEKLTTQLQDQLGESNRIVQEGLSGIGAIKAFNLQQRFSSRYKLLIEQATKKGMRIVMRISSLTPLIYVLQQVPRILCILYGGYLVLNNQITAGGLLAFLFLLSLFVPYLADIPQIMAELFSSAGVARRVQNLLKEEEELLIEDDVAVNKETPAIMFSDVSFSYSDGKKALKDINFDIEKNQTIAIVGQSGSGKSTLLKLICGFYMPSSGHVMLFGKSVDENSLAWIRDHVSMVTQQPHLFSDSIADNIRYGKEGASIDEITAASKLANIHEFISSLTQGYDTLAGEKGGALSGGQKQRITLARALLKEADILVLDEPTSALDNQSEQLIRQTIEEQKNKRTVILVTHRLASVTNADKILVMKEGKIIEQGSHHELMKENGYYASLYRKQETEIGLCETDMENGVDCIV
ncbi:ABC transporter ATP-binding protein [Paenibacillus sp.]|uniref:ABC transporter ATP-binding protein n=1 Tax=Paenibacillus sp. TaxID=58172 RepID=UPI00282E62DC|nr:ABC transporter ATP-binding protein [Paenibacillus sp.]MDR0268392.1 ABC transporter ATP-binding protein/permease [Paenibacillus sp.]